MKIGVIGLGLIGGSFAAAMKSKGHKIIGFDRNESHAEKALEKGLIDEIKPYDALISKSESIVLATPVQIIAEMLPGILQKLAPHQVVFDLGSTKAKMVRSVRNHPNREQYVACHPMAGTEFSGPEAAFESLFDGQFMVICNRHESSDKAVQTIEKLAGELDMKIIEYQAEAHDMHAAYVSHISHISSFALALSVLEKEQNEEDIFKLAAGGFTSTVRLAKSSAHTWTPIFRENCENVLDVLDEHIHQLGQFKTALEENDPKKIDRLINKANEIDKII